MFLTDQPDADSSTDFLDGRCRRGATHTHTQQWWNELAESNVFKAVSLSSVCVLQSILARSLSARDFPVESAAARQQDGAQN